MDDFKDLPVVRPDKPPIQIGTGGFGEVQLVEIGGKKYVWKQYKKLKKREKDETMLYWLKLEIKACELVKDKAPTSEYLMKFYSTEKNENGNICLRMEYLSGMTLHDVITKNHLTARRAKRFTVHLVEGIQILHTLGGSHRDLKPANLMLDSSNFDTAILKIIDYGFSKFQEGTDTSHTSLGTRDYMDVKIKTGSYNAGMADMFSAGKIISANLFSTAILQKMPKEEVDAVNEACHNLLLLGDQPRWGVEQLRASNLFTYCKEIVDNPVIKCLPLSVFIDDFFVAPNGCAAPSSFSFCPARGLAVFGGYGVKFCRLSPASVIFSLRTQLPVTAVAILSKSEVLFSDAVGVWVVDDSIIIDDDHSDIRAKPRLLVPMKDVKSVKTTHGGQWVVISSDSSISMYKSRRTRKILSLELLGYNTGSLSDLAETPYRKLVGGVVTEGELNVWGLEETYEAKRVAISSKWEGIEQRPTKGTRILLSSSGVYCAVCIPEEKCIRVLKNTCGKKEHGIVNKTEEVHRINDVRCVGISFSTMDKEANGMGQGYFAVVHTTRDGRELSVYNVEGDKKCLAKYKLHKTAIAFFTSAKDLCFLDRQGDNVRCGTANLNDKDNNWKVTCDNILHEDYNQQHVMEWSWLQLRKLHSSGKCEGMLSCNGHREYSVLCIITNSELTFVPTDPLKMKIVCLPFHEVEVAKDKSNKYTLRHYSFTFVFTPSEGNGDDLCVLNPETSIQKDSVIASALSVALMDPALSHLASLYDFLDVELPIYPDVKSKSNPGLLKSIVGTVWQH